MWEMITTEENNRVIMTMTIDESAVGFKGKIIFKIYNPKKPSKWGIRLFVLADSDTGYVHSIIPYYGKLAILLKTVRFKNSSLLDGKTRAHCVWC
jgi:hypothetical protein